MNKRRPTFLEIGAPNVVLRALRQVLDLFEFDLVSLEFAPKADEARFTCFDDTDFLLPVVVCSSKVWRVLRAVNLWRRTVPFVRKGVLTWPDQTPTEACTLPVVIPLRSGPSASLYEHLVSGGIGVVTALQWILTPQPLVTHIERHQLARAALRMFRPDYHAIRPAGEDAPDNHRQSDFHSALRILQGAALDGWIPADDWLKVSNEVLKYAANPIQWEPGNFTAGLQQIAEGELIPVESFGTLLVVDDEQFWRAALTPLCDRHGISVRQMRTKEELARTDPGDGGPVRAILLDMKFGEGRYVGVEFLRELKKTFKHVPVVVLSVEDDLSVADLLKREGVFASISKRSTAEEFGCRDEVSAFCQLRDALVLACFASLTREFGYLYRVITDSAGVTETKIERFEETLGGYIDQALSAFAHGCRHIYADVWEGLGRSRGLSCRQIIRALGLVNDKWCELWTKCQFDPDENGAAWTRDVDRSGHHRTYHHIATQLRNLASHAWVRDDCFRWTDVWVMSFAVFLKIEGLFRSLVSPPKRESIFVELDRRLEACTIPTWALLRMAGYLDKAGARGENADVLIHGVRVESEELRNALFDWSRRQMSEIPLSTNRAQLAVAPYLARHLGDGFLLHELAQSGQTASPRTAAQLRADLLVLDLVKVGLRDALGSSPAAEEIATLRDDKR